MDLHLPGGETVDVCRPDLIRMAALSPHREIPTFLSGVVMTAFHPTADKPKPTSLKQQQIADLSRFIDVVIKCCLVWPRIVDTTPDYDAGEIGFYDLSEQDRQFIFQWAMPDGLDAVTSYVSNRGALWELYRVGQLYQARPSTLVGITDTWLAWDFDKAVTALGMHIENELNKPTDTKERSRLAEKTRQLKRLLGVQAVSKELITTHEQAIAAGFIPMPSKPKDSI